MSPFIALYHVLLRYLLIKTFNIMLCLIFVHVNIDILIVL